MYEILKKGGIFLGHAICIFILVYCFSAERQVASGQLDVAQKPVITETPVPLPTISPTVIVTATPVPTATFTPVATVTPTVSPTPAENTLVTSTPVPTIEPTTTSTPVPTIEPTATVAPIPTATMTPIPSPTDVPAATDVSENESTETKGIVMQKIAEGQYAALENEKNSWWFRRKENQIPSGSGEAFKIYDYHGFYRNTKVAEEDKVLYLTIDCGYDSPNTMAMLDVFQKHEIKVTFFVTSFFMEDSPKELKRMVKEGHTVANHTVSHADLTELTDQEIYEEIVGCADMFFEMTGTQMAMYFRPPEGAYSKRTLQITEDLGYKTIFWSIAYRDYDVNNQPGRQYVLDHFATYHHNGAIPLMHNDSVSNAEAMDELITYLKEQGYRFGTLDELN